MTGLQAVIRAAAEHMQVSPEEIVSSRRVSHLVRARQLAAYVARVRYGASLPQIGRALNRDHTTVLYHVRAMAENVPVADIAIVVARTEALLAQQGRR